LTPGYDNYLLELPSSDALHFLSQSVIELPVSRTRLAF